MSSPVPDLIFSQKLNGLIDEALTRQHSRTPHRTYLGASRLERSCQRSLQYEFLHTPKDEETSGQHLRIFDIGHLFEDLAVKWLGGAGLHLVTRKPDGKPFGFSAAQGCLRGHVDGILQGAPEELGLTFPAVWECKSLNAKSWKDVVKHGVTKSQPVYATQIALYAAYMEGVIPGISQNPALFTAINKNTAELYHELLPFDAPRAQSASDRAVKILRACTYGETLPRLTKDPEYFECRFCSYQQECWKGDL